MAILFNAMSEKTRISEAINMQAEFALTTFLEVQTPA